jgi:hypothetical protein
MNGCGIRKQPPCKWQIYVYLLTKGGSALIDLFASFMNVSSPFPVLASNPKQTTRGSFEAIRHKQELSELLSGHECQPVISHRKMSNTHFREIYLE